MRGGRGGEGGRREEEKEGEKRSMGRIGRKTNMNGHIKTNTFSFLQMSNGK